MSVIISMLSRKGGTGKTSLSIHLAGLWASEGLSVRLVDCDNQASLSQFCLGREVVENLKPEETVEGCLAGGKPETIERATPIKNVSIVPARVTLQAKHGDEMNLWTRSADITLIDTPPDIHSPIIKAAILTSNFVLSPVDPEAFGAASIASVQDKMHSVAIAYNPKLQLLGFVVNKRERLSVHAAIEDTLRRIHVGAIMDTVVPSLVAFKEAIVARQPITMYKPQSKAADAIRQLSTEIFARMENAVDRRAA